MLHLSQLEQVKHEITEPHMRCPIIHAGLIEFTSIVTLFIQNRQTQQIVQFYKLAVLF